VPAEDPERHILYGGFTLSCCLVEVFGDTRRIEVEDWFLAELTPTRPLRLLDLRRSGAMRAGLTAAVAKIPDRASTQQVSRSIYEHPGRYSAVDGLIWLNAHNDEDAWALYERAEDALTIARSLPLGDPLLAAAIAAAAFENNLDIPTP
jgi:hypothetical protein